MQELFSNNLKKVPDTAGPRLLCRSLPWKDGDHGERAPAASDVPAPRIAPKQAGVGRMATPMKLGGARRGAGAPRSVNKKRGSLEPRNIVGADNGARTRDPNLGKVVLYQLSHVRLRGFNIRDDQPECKNYFRII